MRTIYDLDGDTLRLCCDLSQWGGPRPRRFDGRRPFTCLEVYRRQKHPFLAPLELKSRMRELIRDTLRPAQLGALPFFDPKVVERFLAAEPPVDDVGARSGYFGAQIVMTSLCILQQRYAL